MPLCASGKTLVVRCGQSGCPECLTKYSWSSHRMARTLWLAAVASVTCGQLSAEEWLRVYSQSFDRVPAGTKTASTELPDWEGLSAAGVVFDGQSGSAGRFLIAASAWTSFNQGPILNLDLTANPHDRIRIHFDLYTFGDWRGLQSATGGPQHRLMFFDNKASPTFAFDTNFSTNPNSRQSWPERSPAVNTALNGAKPAAVDTTGRFPTAHRWPIEFEYPSNSPSLRFTILCGAAAGSGRLMPHFGIDNVVVSVRSTAPVITPVDRPQDRLFALNNPPTMRGSLINFEVLSQGRTSVGIFSRNTGRLIRTLLQGERLPAGRHSVEWDGLDNQGKPVDTGTCEWRAITVPGFTAKYITTIGINPPGGENPVPRRSWVGDHTGGGIVDVDESGTYVGSPMTEGLMMLAKVDATKTRVAWTREQFYQSGQLTKAAASSQHVFMLHPNGKLRRLNKDTGRVEAEWQIGQEGTAPGDVDAHKRNLVIADGSGNRIKWLSAETGTEIESVPLQNPTCVAAMDANEKSAAAAASGADIYVVRPGQKAQKVATLSATVGAMDYDPVRRELWAVVNGHQVVCLDEKFQILQTYSDQPREFGPFDPTKFARVYDVAADLKGGFLVGEPGHPPRRIAHIARDGSLIDQWLGGMSFYVGGTFDPDDPSRLYGIAPEGCVNVYHIDYDAGTWELEAAYATGRLCDSMFPHAGAFRAVRQNGQLYLYHQVVPAVIRLDAEQRRAIPVAIAGRVLNKGRTFFQFAGSGRDGYPKPWVAAAEHHGYQDLNTAPKLYSWADTNGNGKAEPAEFRFYENAERGLSFHNPGDFTTNGDYIGSANVNETHALVHLPVSGWEGPQKTAPRWDWGRLQTSGEIIADSYGYGSPRGISVGPDDSIFVAWQAGIMIRAHGQYEGGGWPEAAMRGSRVLGFDAGQNPVFSAGRQSKDAKEVNTGVLYYPMQTASGPNRSVIVNDQTKQPAQVWTHDGLYAGGFFDDRASDGRDAGFYRIHGDDNQGATVVTAANGRTYWLMPYQGHNRLYEIAGWKNWQRQSGNITLTTGSFHSPKGTGLTARYYQGRKPVLETIEPPIFFEKFGAERHAEKVTAHYKAVWTGSVEAPLTDRFRFRSLIGNGEQVAVWVDGRLVHTNGFQKENADHPVRLTAGHRHRIHVEYINPDGRAELKLLWCSSIMDPQQLTAGRLYPE